MASTRWADVVQQLVVRMRATTGYRAPWSGDPAAEIAVFHSVEIALQGEYTTGRYLVVGWPGSPDPAEFDEAGSSEQETGPMASGRPRNEYGIVRCRAVYQGGDGGEMQDGIVDAALRAALAIVADVENNLRAPADGPTLGIAAPWVVAEMGKRTQFFPILSEGVAYAVDFELIYSTRI
jgi:hypothetical protein